MIKKFISIVLTLALIAGCFSFAFAEAEPERVEIPMPEIFGIEAPSKTAAPGTEEGEYKVTLSVPGAESTAETSGKHNEVIIMVDGSISQGSNLGSLKKSLSSLGASFFTEDESTCLTLMGFGFSPNTFGHFYDLTTLNEALDGVSDGEGFLYGVSATNCEAAFNWINAYLNGEDAKNINEAVVLFTSDGEANYDESPVDFSKWTAGASKWALPETVEDPKKDCIMDYVDYGIKLQRDCVVTYGAALLPATVELITNYNENITEGELPIDLTDLDAVDSFLRIHYVDWINLFLKDIFASIGLTYDPDGFESTMATFERAMWGYLRALGHNYDYRYGWGIVFLNLYINVGKYQPDYYAGSGNDEFGSRAADACDLVVANSKVKNVYLVGFKTNHKDKNPATHWMNPDSSVNARVTKNDKLAFIESENLEDAIDKIKTQVEDTVIKTMINNPVVTDPMSEYVDLDQDSIEVTFNGTTIWTAADGWEGAPVKVVKDPETGKDKIEWKVKDGALLITDRYAMTYTVKMNVENPEEGKEYELNDPTKLLFDDEKGAPKQVDIEVPEVELVPETPVTGSTYEPKPIHQPEDDPEDKPEDKPEDEQEEMSASLPMEEDIPDEEPPLAELPDEEPPLGGIGGGDDLDELPEEDVPLADVPETGDTNIVLFAAGTLTALMMVAFCLRKREER